MAYLNLSICIPTFNRFQLLKNILDETLNFILNNNIELCISSNASSDGTDEYLKNLVLLHPKIKINLQKHNVGIDNNMIDVISMASRDYILPMGDDDILIIEDFLSELKALQAKPDLFILNCLNKGGHHLSQSLRGITFLDKNEAFLNLWSKMPFGSFIFSKKLFYKGLNNKFIGTSHAYSGYIWNAISLIDSPKIYCGIKPVIKFIDYPKTYLNDEFKIKFYQIPLWFTLLRDQYSIIDERDILKNYMIYICSFKMLLQYRAKDHFYLNNVKRYMSFFNHKQVKKAYYISFFPRFILSFLLKKLKKIKKVIKWVIH